MSGVAEPRLLEESGPEPGDDGVLDGESTIRADAEALALDDLTVLASITSRWPRPVAAQGDEAGAVLSGPEELGDGAAEPASLSAEAVDTLAGTRPAAPDEGTPRVADEEGETDEMDSLAG